MLKQLIKLSFYQQLIILSIVAFTTHISALKLLHLPVFDHKIVTSYLLNFIISLLLFFVIDKFKQKFKDNIGFIFMLSSFIKFALYFIFIQPYISNNGVITKVAFFTFYIPYAIYLIFETSSLIKLLNKIDYHNR